MVRRENSRQQQCYFISFFCWKESTESKRIGEVYFSRQVFFVLPLLRRGCFMWAHCLPVVNTGKIGFYFTHIQNIPTPISKRYFGGLPRTTCHLLVLYIQSFCLHRRVFCDSRILGERERESVERALFFNSVILQIY